MHQNSTLRLCQRLSFQATVEPRSHPTPTFPVRFDRHAAAHPWSFWHPHLNAYMAVCPASLMAMHCILCILPQAYIVQHITLLAQVERT